MHVLWHHRSKKKHDAGSVHQILQLFTVGSKNLNLWTLGLTGRSKRKNVFTPNQKNTSKI